MNDAALWTVIGALLAVVALNFTAVFHGIGGRLEALEARLNARFDRVDDRLDGLDARMDVLETRMDGLETRMERLDYDVQVIAERVFRDDPD